MTERLEIDEVVVVEGRSDTQNLQRAAVVDTIETGGSALNASVIKTIAHATQRRGVIVLTDPDFNGERLRRIITEAVPGVQQAFISQDQGRAERDNPHKSLGVEHASIVTLQRALMSVSVRHERPQSDVTRSFLQDAGLIGGTGASQARQQLSELLQIGHVNGKQLYRRLHAYGITVAEVTAALKGNQRG